MDDDITWRKLLNEMEIVTTMAALDPVLAATQRAVPDCLAVGLVDLASGLLLGSKTVDNHPQEVLALVAGATAEMFQGPTIVEIEKLFRQRRGGKEDGVHYIQKIVFWSTNLLHCCVRSKKNENFVVVVVCRVSANVGMVMAKTDIEVPKIEAAAGV